MRRDDMRDTRWSLANETRRHEEVVRGAREGERDLAAKRTKGAGKRTPDWTELERNERAARAVDAGQAKEWRSKDDLPRKVGAGRGSVGSQQVDRGGRIKQRGRAQGAGSGGNMLGTNRRGRNQRNE